MESALWAVHSHAFRGAEEAVMKSHSVWWPHLDRDRLFNPFVPVTDHHPPSDRVEFPETEEPSDAEAPAQAPTPSEERER